VIAGYLKHLKTLAEAQTGGPISRAVLGRPVFFVDDDPARDAQAQAALTSAARAVGFSELSFQYEPIAAAFEFERTVQREQIVLVADIGGGTSDFAVVRVGPDRATRLERKDDILASHGVHVAGTDFDRRIELACLLGEFGYGAWGAVSQPPGRPKAGCAPRGQRSGGAASSGAVSPRHAAARGAERGLLRPGDLAPDQHRVQPAARGRAARHAQVLRRAAPSRAPDDGAD